MSLPHLLAIKDLNREYMTSLFEFAAKIEQHPEQFADSCRGKILATVFFEPSTRTRLSFESAMHRLGGNVLGFSEPSISSHKKGESFHDTLQMINGYADIAVVRHFLEGIGEVVHNHGSIPVVSGGTGTQEHPSQALLDLYTVHKEFGSIDGKTFCLMGDLRYGRTIPSLLYGLSQFDDITVHLVSPELLRVRREVLVDVQGKLTIEEHSHYGEILPDLNVLYATRIQKERFPDPSDYEKVKGSYVIRRAELEQSKVCDSDFILMHPLPRVGEISYGVDRLKCARYFEQARNGVWVRMAIILRLLGLEAEFGE